MLPSVISDSFQDYALLKDLVAAEGFAARAEYVNRRWADSCEEFLTEEPEVRARRETARSYEQKLSAFSQDSSGRSHEECIDVRLPVNDDHSGLRPAIVLGNLEVRRIRDNKIETLYRLCIKQIPVSRQTSGMGQQKVLPLDPHAHFNLMLSGPALEIIQCRREGLL